MPAPTLDFEFYAGGIEDGIIDVLTPIMQAAPLSVRELTTYSGELDREALQEAIASQARMFPMVMVSYAGGESFPYPATPAVKGRKLRFRHDCHFLVIVADDNPFSEKARRRSKVYGMISAVWTTLTGIRLKKTVNVPPNTDYLLTIDPLIPVANDYIERLPNITAYAVSIKTAFKWVSPDRQLPGTPVSQLIVGVDNSKNSAVVQQPDNMPGVTFEVEK